MLKYKVIIKGRINMSYWYGIILFNDGHVQHLKSETVTVYRQMNMKVTRKERAKSILQNIEFHIEIFSSS